MKTTNLIGLDVEKSQRVAELLNVLLANYQIYYQNLRGFHWNIKGNRFFVLHAKFEELYNDAMVKADEIAERVLMLGATPLHSYARYEKVASIQARENVTEGDVCLKAVMEDVLVLLQEERAIMAAASEAGDDGTLDLLNPYISGQEKLLWMLNAYLNGK
ncbi:MAG: Dps family protein [Odoribacter sp.]